MEDTEDKHKHKRPTRHKKTEQDNLPINKLKLLITVVDRRKGEYYADLIQSFDVNMQMMCFGRGTAKVEMLRYLGLADSDKTVIFSVVREDKVESIFEELSEKFENIKNGKGIAFTVPMSSVIGVAIYGFLSNNRSAVKEGQ